MTAPVMRRVDFHWLLAGRGAGWWDLELEHTLWAQQSRVGYWLDLEGQYDVYIRIALVDISVRQNRYSISSHSEFAAMGIV